MLKWINKKRNQKGFTLVELVVVIAILGILAAIAVPKLSKSRENAAIAAHNANVRTLESAATLAVSEGSGAIDWDKDTNKDGNFGWEKYLQDWPEVPTGVAGKVMQHEVKDDEGNITKPEEKLPSAYTVEILENGVIKVLPGKIPTK